ncbi:hypothetical protein RKD23_000966 [Streptomyces sp. SAI-170]
MARYQALLHPWLDRGMDHAIRIHPELLTGLRLTAA